MEWLIVGISGATCSGKTTLARKLHKNFKNSVLIEQDNYFLSDNDPRHIWIPELNHNNFDIISSVDMDKMHSDILKILNEDSRSNDKSNNEVKVLIIEGFLFFDYKPIFDLCSLKFFLTLTKEECWNRRQSRTYLPPDVPGYFDKIVWPEYLKHKEKIKSKDTLATIKFFDGTKSQEEVYSIILDEVKSRLN